MQVVACCSQLIFVQIQSVLVFVLEIEIVVEVEVLVFLGAIIELGEIQLRHVIPDQGLGQRPFLGLQSRAAFQVGDVLGPVLDGHGQYHQGDVPRSGPRDDSSRGRWPAARPPG